MFTHWIGHHVKLLSGRNQRVNERELIIRMHVVIIRSENDQDTMCLQTSTTAKGGLLLSVELRCECSFVLLRVTPGQHRQGLACESAEAFKVLLSLRSRRKPSRFCLACEAGGSIKPGA